MCVHLLQVAQQMLLDDAPLSLQQMHAKLLHGLFNVSATPAVASALAALDWSQPSLSCKQKRSALVQAAHGWATLTRAAVYRLHTPWYLQLGAAQHDLHGACQRFSGSVLIRISSAACWHRTGLPCCLPAVCLLVRNGCDAPHYQPPLHRAIHHMQGLNNPDCKPSYAYMAVTVLGKLAGATHRFQGTKVRAHAADKASRAYAGPLGT